MEVYYKFLVIGNEPEEIVKYFNAKTQVEPYVKYSYAKAGVYRSNMITTLRKMLKEKSLSEELQKYFSEELENIEQMSDEDYYYEITYGLELDDHLNVISTTNPEAKFNGAAVATENEAYPFILKDGTKAFSAKLEDIDWEATKTEDGEKYDRTWELIVRHAKVKTEEDAKIYRNYDALRSIAAVFKTKENYINANTLFFTPYVAKKERGEFKFYAWDSSKFVDWILNFNKKFFSKMPGDTLITLYYTKEMF